MIMEGYPGHKQWYLVEILIAYFYEYFVIMDIFITGLQTTRL